MFEGPQGIFPLTFPDHIQHDLIGMALTKYPAIKATSAGFYHTLHSGEELKVITCGESISLKLKSYSEDAYWIKKYLFNND